VTDQPSPADLSSIAPFDTNAPDANAPSSAPGAAPADAALRDATPLAASAAPPVYAPGTTWVPQTVTGGTAAVGTTVTFSPVPTVQLDAAAQSAVCAAVNAAVHSELAAAVERELEGVASRVLGAGHRTSEGRLVFGLVGLLQVVAAVWAWLLSAGAIHPTDAIAAGVPGVAEALSAWLAQQYSGHRSTLKAVVAASAPAITEAR